MTEKQMAQCHIIIHSNAVLCGAGNAAPLPGQPPAHGASAGPRRPEMQAPPRPDRLSGTQSHEGPRLKRPRHRIPFVFLEIDSQHDTERITS